MHDDDESHVTGPLDGGADPAVQEWIEGLPDASGTFEGTFDTGAVKYFLSNPCSVCGGFGWIGNDWLHQRSPKCTCPAASDDFTWTVHSMACDSVPCPFCSLEAS